MRGHTTLPKETQSKLIVVIPCLNEAISISDTIQEVFRYSPAAQIYVVDNNSSDSTAENAKASGAQVIFEPSPGKGRAFRSALKAIPKDFDALLMIDGDGTYDVSRITEALGLITNSGIDLVVGTRNADSASEKSFRRGHRLGNKGFSILSKTFHSSQIEDSLSGWRLMSHQFIGTFPSNSQGFEIETEINAHARNFDLNVANIDIHYRERPEDSFSKLRTYKDGYRILISNFRIALQNRPLTFLGIPSFFAVLTAVPLIYRAVSGYLRNGTVDQLPSLLVGTSMAAGGIIFAAIGYLLEQMRRMHVSNTRQNYFLSVRKSPR
jgi:glycosyltransferase involved in cell wall biosynthesis